MNHKLIEENVQPKDMPYLSPSSINLFIKEPALWVMKHFFGQTGIFGIYAMRGVAIEDGVNAFVSGACKEDAAMHALDNFSEKAFSWADTDLLETLESQMYDWTLKAIEALQATASGGRITMQKELDSELFGFPIRGFLDYETETLDIDLKTCNTLPTVVTRGDRKGFLSKSKADNVRQQAIYNAVTGKETALLYVAPDGFMSHTILQEEIDEIMPSVEEALEKIKYLLTLPISGVIKESQPNWKSMEYGFFWDDNLRALANHLWAKYKPEGGKEL